MSRMVPEVAGKALGKKGAGYGKLVTEWTAIVGEEMALYTQPMKLSFPRGERADATLTLEVVPARALELQHALPQLVERVNAVFGYRAVAKVKMVQRPPDRPVRLANLRPLSPVEEDELLELTSVVADGDLRAALENLGRAVQARVR